MIGGALIVIWAWLKWGWRGVKWISPVRRISQLEAIEVKVGNIEKQVQFNGGQTMRDEVRHIKLALGVNNGLTSLILEDRGMITFTTDATGAWTSVSRGWLKITGQTVRNSLGWAWTSSIIQADRANVITEYERCIKAGIPFVKSFTVFDSRTHQETLIDVYAEEATDDNNQYIGQVTDPSKHRDDSRT